MSLTKDLIPKKDTCNMNEWLRLENVRLAIMNLFSRKLRLGVWIVILFLKTPP